LAIVADRVPGTRSEAESLEKSGQEGERRVSFGFKEVPENERQGLVNKVFARSAKNYDLMNDLMSGGLHRLWKSDFLAWLAPPSVRSGRRYRLLDVAGGTGDIALAYARMTSPLSTAVICDISPEMLEVGRKRVREAGLSGRVDLVEGNAEALPFPDRSFDAYTIAFGIRNVTHIDKALSEAFRVLKVGGRFMCLEFSEVDVPGLDRLYDLHSFEVIPRLGEVVSGDRDSYQYLVESIRKFPNQERFAGMIRAAGFERVTYRNLTGGIAAMHSGWRL
jgi:demethylmenaquinone methyltransferase / 2-methoxy-6-polyprenyl-1,4-benzoquinol methylase